MQSFKALVLSKTDKGQAADWTQLTPQQLASAPGLGTRRASLMARSFATARTQPFARWLQALGVPPKVAKSLTNWSSASARRASDWRALDERLAARTRPHVFNVNDRGARFRGTTLIPPDQFALDAPEGAKHAALAAVAPLASDAPAISTALTRLRATAANARRVLPDLQRALDRGGPAALATAFRPLLTDPECSRFLGAFALKLMPHLVPPIEGDAALWRKFVTEFAELTAFVEQPASQTGES